MLLIRKPTRLVVIYADHNYLGCANVSIRGGGRWNRETWQDGTRSNSTIEQRGLWLYDCALTGALSCFIKRRRTVDGRLYKTTQWWPRKRRTRHWAIDQSISLSLL